MKRISKMTRVSGESQECLARCLMGTVFIILLTASFLMISCSLSRNRINDGTDPMSADSGLLSNGFLSLDDLGRATIKALNDSSAEELAALLVTEKEFRDVIFARTPDSLKAGMPVEQAWLWNSADSKVAIERKLDKFGKRDFRFVKAAVQDTTTVFPGKTTYRNVMLTVENRNNGQQIEFRFLNVVAMVGGRCKVVAFHK
jgi:hypothetical protein